MACKVKRKETCIVFDCMGTLVQPFGIVKEEKLKKISEYISIKDSVYSRRLSKTNPISDLLAENPNIILVILDCAPEKINKFNPNLKLKELAKNKEIRLKIGQHISSKLSLCNILNIVSLNETLTLGAIQEAMNYARKNYPIDLIMEVVLIIDFSMKSILYVGVVAGKIFSEAYKLIRNLNRKQIDIYMASGDRPESLLKIALRLGIQKNKVFGYASPEDKRALIQHLKQKYQYVLMVGNDKNDIPALEIADFSIVTTQQNVDEQAIKVADTVISDLSQLMDVIRAVFKSFNKGQHGI